MWVDNLCCTNQPRHTHTITMMFQCFLLIMLLHFLNSKYSITQLLWADVCHNLASSIMTWGRGHYCSHNLTLAQHNVHSRVGHIVSCQSEFLKHTMKFFQTRSANPWITPLHYIPPTHIFLLTCWINSLTTLSFALFTYVFIEHLFIELCQAT